MILSKGRSAKEAVSLTHSSLRGCKYGIRVFCSEPQGVKMEPEVRDEMDTIIFSLLDKGKDYLVFYGESENFRVWIDLKKSFFTGQRSFEELSRRAHFVTVRDVVSNKIVWQEM